jgi:hypothetical protein
MPDTTQVNANTKGLHSTAMMPLLLAAVSAADGLQKNFVRKV